MVLTPELVDVRHLIRDDESLGTGDTTAIEAVIAGAQVAEAHRELATFQSDVAESTEVGGTARLRLGIVSYLFGRHEQAVENLTQVSGSGVASYYQGLALMALDRYAQAAEAFEQAAHNGYEKAQCALVRAGAVRMQGNPDEAETIVRSVASEAAGRAEYSYQMGCILADRGDTYGAVEYFERAVDIDSHHSQALFRLAAENCNRGNDDDAIRLYEQSLSKPPHYLGALLNLGLLYEDSENYKAAAYCFRKILEVDPNHPRAHLYLKDIEATSDMYYDEESARNEARLTQLLSRPVTDFELSVRSRNCLQAMDIFTLGDLTRVSEHDLLSGKNFGETSLDEIRDVMQAHGLMIGQNLRPGKSSDHPVFQQSSLSPEEQALLDRPITDLNLSVRARKCMSRLGLTSLTELVQRTADELLSSRNFGVTSLNEIRAKLNEAGLKLRND